MSYKTTSKTLKIGYLHIMKDRIKQLMVAQHMTQQSFADVLGISAASLSSIFNDRTKPTLNHVDAIKNKFPSINLDWLLYGRGPMFLDAESTIAATEETEVPAASEQVLDFGASSTTPSIISAGRTSGMSGSNMAGRDNNNVIKIIDKPTRHITEIRIFYDDQTWETFVPKK